MLRQVRGVLKEDTYLVVLLNPRRRRLLPTTKTLERAIAAPANIGQRQHPSPWPFLGPLGQDLIHLVLGQDLAKNGKMVDRLEDLEAQEINEVIVLPLQETYLDRPGPPSLIVATATLRDDNLWTQAIAGASL